MSRAVRLTSLLLAAPMAINGGLGFLLARWFLRPARYPVRETPARYGLQYESLWLTSADGTRLAAWFVPRPGARAAVVLCHGYPANRSDVLDLIPPLHRAGFHVLAFDFRAMGESEGRICTLGREEPEDVRAAVAYLRAHPDVDPERVGVLGISMGAACALMAAARDPGIRAVVADSAFARLDEMVEERFRFLPLPLRRPLVFSTTWWGERLAGFSAAQVSPEVEVAHIALRPVLFIHGACDTLIPVAHARRLHAAAGAPKALWIVPEAGHVRAWANRPAEYEVRIVTFFREALGV